MVLGPNFLVNTSLSLFGAIVFRAVHISFVYFKGALWLLFQEKSSTWWRFEWWLIFYCFEKEFISFFELLFPWYCVIGSCFLAAILANWFLWSVSDQVYTIFYSILLVCYLLIVPLMLLLLVKTKSLQPLVLFLHKVLKFLRSLWKIPFKSWNLISFRHSFLNFLANIIQKMGLIILVTQLLKNIAVPWLNFAVRIWKRRLIMIWGKGYSLLPFDSSFHFPEIQLSQILVVFFNCPKKVTIFAFRQIPTKFIVLAQMRYLVGILLNSIRPLQILLFVSVVETFPILKSDGTRKLLYNRVNRVDIVKVDSGRVFFEESACHVDEEGFRLAESAEWLLEEH